MQHQLIQLEFVPAEIQTSAYPGRIIVTEPKAIVQPTITVDKFNTKRAVVGDDVTLPCVAQGHPVPGYYWKRETDGQTTPVLLGERARLLTAGLLRISKVSFKSVHPICSKSENYVNKG